MIAPINIASYEHVEMVPVEVGVFTHDDTQWTIRTTGKHDLWGNYAGGNLITAVDVSREFGPSASEFKAILICGKRALATK